MPKHKILLLTVSLTVFCVGFFVKTTKISAQEENETTLDVCVGTCSPTPSPTPTPTATPTASPTATATPTASPIATPTPTPVVLPGEFIIYGYGPSESTINMTGIGVNESTVSDELGYFEFKNLPFPTIFSIIVNLFYPEVCFEAVDEDTRTTSPLCIPGLPDTITTNAVGPILLSPTLSIDKKSIAINESVIASGKTTPNTKVTIYFSRENKEFIFKVVEDVSAYSLPIYEVESSDNGYFEFSLPSNTPDDWKVFAASEIEGSNSASSNTLSFSVNPSIYKALKVYEDISYYIKPTLFKVVVAMQFILIIILLLTIRYINKKDDRYVSSTVPIEKTGKKTKRSLAQLQSNYQGVHEEYIKFLKQKRHL